MQLKSLEYSQFRGTQNEWKLAKTTFGDIDLIVGKNASGKTRTINVLSALAGLLSGKRKPNLQSSNYKVIFEHNGDEIKFNLIIEESKVTKEELVIGGKKVLMRHASGKGKIFAQELNKYISFQTPVSELTSNTRRDSVQHPFFEDMFNWADALSTYRFGTPLGKDTMIILKNDSETEKALDGNEATHVTAMFRKGKKEYKQKFVNSIRKDMKIVGYEIEEIGVDKPTSIITDMNLASLYVKEKGISMRVDQNEISQGMFRALSLIIQINYLQLLKERSGILIDDIGEGLDFERSSNLIGILIKKAEEGHVQLIMSTNDRFVMNNVPLKYWAVIQRTKRGSKIFNVKNSKKAFDDFSFTGLNNFDFFSKGFFEDSQ